MDDNILICQKWSVKQSGRPTIEGEFCSLHANEAKLWDFVSEYDSKKPREVPDSYACLARSDEGKLDPFFRCRVDAATYKRVCDSGVGLWSTTVPQATVDAVSIIPAREFMSLTEGMM